MNHQVKFSEFKTHLVDFTSSDKVRVDVSYSEGIMGSSERGEMSAKV